MEILIMDKNSLFKTFLDVLTPGSPRCVTRIKKINEESNNLNHTLQKLELTVNEHIAEATSRAAEFKQ